MKPNLNYSDDSTFGLPFIVRVQYTDTIQEIKRKVYNILKKFSSKPADNYENDKNLYILEIFNNREIQDESCKAMKSSISEKKYMKCKFCKRGAHSNNCIFEFKNENTLILGNILDYVERNREFILSARFILDYKNLHYNDLKHETNIPSAFNDNAKKLSPNKSIFSEDNSLLLQDLFKEYCKEEILDEKNMHYCEVCKNQVRACKTFF